MKKTKVSVVVTAYGVRDYIRQCVLSILQQSFQDLELIVVDDASDDGTAEVLDAVMKSEADPRMRVIRNEQNLGAGQSRQVGIDAACGEFVQLVDGDDYLSPSFIESLVKVQETTQSPIVSGGMTIDKGEGAYESHIYGSYTADAITDINKWWGKRTQFLCNMIVRRDLYDKVAYCPRRYIEDTQTLYKLLYYAGQISYAPDAGYFYRMRQGSLTHTSNAVKDGIYRSLCAMDIMLFFSDKEPELQKKFGIELFASALNALKSQRPTREQIEPYKEDFIELMTFVLNV